MITEFLLFIATGLALSLILVMAKVAISCKIARDKWRKQVKSIPFDEEGIGLLSNHITSWFFKNNLNRAQRLHDKHGKYVAWLAGTVPAVSTTDLDFIKKHHVDAAMKNINRPKLEMPVTEFEKDSLLFAQDEQWRRLRKAFAPALKSRIFNAPNVVSAVEKTINKLIDGIDAKLAETKDNDFDSSNLMHRYSLNLVVSCLYKQGGLVDFNLKKDCPYVKNIDDGYNSLIEETYRYGMILPPIRHLIEYFIKYLDPIGKWRQEVMKYIEQQTKKGLEARKHLQELRRHHPEATLDEDNFILKDGSKFSRGMLDPIIDEFHMGKINKTEFFNTSYFLFGAADKTSSDCLSFTLYILAEHPKIQEKLRAEVKKFGKDSEYLTWVINESMRVFPPGPSGCTRIMSEDVKLDSGDILPAGTLVLTPLNVIHRLKEYWGEDADEFRPERFAKSDTFHPCQFMPFGAGLRKCLGGDFAMFEMRMVLSALISRYSFQPSPKCCEYPLKSYNSPTFVFVVNDIPFHVKISKISDN